MFDIPSENLRGMSCYRYFRQFVGLPAGGPGSRTRLGCHGPGFRLGCGRHLIAYEYYLSGAMKFLWYVL